MNKIRPVGDVQKNLIEKSHVVELPAKEWANSVLHGSLRAMSYKDHGGDTSRGKTLELVHAEGALAETIVMYKYGFEPDYISDPHNRVYSGVDRGVDLIINDNPTDVKSTSSTEPYLLVKKYKEIQDIYILVRLMGKSSIETEPIDYRDVGFKKRTFSLPTRGRILGYATGEQVRNAPVRRWPRDIKNRIVPFSELKPLPEGLDVSLP